MKHQILLLVNSLVVFVHFRLARFIFIYQRLTNNTRNRNVRKQKNIKYIFKKQEKRQQSPEHVITIKVIINKGRSIRKRKAEN